MRHFFGGLCKLVARHLERDEGAAVLVATIIARLCRRESRLMALVARFKAGTLLLTSRARAARSVPPPAMRAPRAPDPVPRCRAYLARLLRHEAAVYGRILEILLADPEMMALLAASPEGGRVLRPLWRMLSPRRYPPMLQPLPRDAAASLGVAGRGRPTASWASSELHDMRGDPPHEDQPSWVALPITT